MTLPAGKTPEMSGIRIDVVVISVGQKKKKERSLLNQFEHILRNKGHDTIILQN